MLGDCTDVSVDSRVWGTFADFALSISDQLSAIHTGPLPDSYVAGRPIATFNLRQPLQ